jgi:hypothetical protein
VGVDFSRKETIAKNLEKRRKDGWIAGGARGN